MRLQRLVDVTMERQPDQGYVIRLGRAVLERGHGVSDASYGDFRCGTTVAGEERLESRFAEHLPICVGGLRHTVGVDEHEVTGRKNE